jgi:hypothetical protein
VSNRAPAVKAAALVLLFCWIGVHFDRRTRSAYQGARFPTRLNTVAVRAPLILQSTAVRSIVGKADVVIVSIGGNDLFGNQAARLFTLLSPSLNQVRVVNRVATIVAKISRINPNARIYLLGLFNPYQGSSLRSFLDQEVALWDSSLIGRFATSPESMLSGLLTSSRSAVA